MFGKKSEGNSPETNTGWLLCYGHPMTSLSIKQLFLNFSAVLWEKIKQTIYGNFLHPIYKLLCTHILISVVKWQLKLQLPNQFLSLRIVRKWLFYIKFHFNIKGFWWKIPSDHSKGPNMNLETETEEFWIKLFRFVKSAIPRQIDWRPVPKKRAPMLNDHCLLLYLYT